ncbi:UBX domain-containing protein 8 isoform X4 [Dromiciops gliroides]|uniref:UBX domain-containing protein 8 isoform X4 n=1 Tax=Dromiciops gliroides TaxID=33562 RepID=UPI001CC52682|nr:UBX domain-containing protein 8 isoform X4 [Dromiciops gliroides]
MSRWSPGGSTARAPRPRPGPPGGFRLAGRANEGRDLGDYPGLALGLEGWKDIFLLGGRGLLFLAILTFIISMTAPWLTSRAPSKVCSTVTEDENKRRQKRVREEQQETLSSKGPEEPGLAGEDGAPGDTPSRKASRRRKLPEPASRVSASPEQPRAKKVLALPEEPPETAAEVVAVALRCPDGRMFRRRFYKSCSAQVLLDWMMKVGYHSSIYTLSNSYPRRPLEVGEDQTLEDTGLTTDTVLNVEEKEPCPSP